MRKTVLYRITNTATGKCYIGQTKQGLKQRKAEHLCRLNLGERDHKLYQSMRKHGVEKFKFEVICSALDEKYLDELEVLLIEQHNSFNRGYNSTVGGNSVSEETRQKIRSKLLGRTVTWAHKAQETRKNSGKKYGCCFEALLPTGERVTGQGVRKFCDENKLDLSNFYRTMRGEKLKGCKGFILVRTFNDYPEGEYA